MTSRSHLIRELNPDTRKVIEWAGGCSESTLRTIVHAEKVFEQIGTDVRAPASIHWLYAMYTDPEKAGERLRRVLSSKEVFALSCLWRDHKHRQNNKPGNVQRFADWLAKELPDLSEERRRDILLELWQLKVNDSEPGWAELAAQAFDTPFKSVESQHSFRRFVHRYAALREPTQTPGQYALMLTNDGESFEIDVVQAFTQGLVAEAHGHSKPFVATAFQTWRSVLSRTIRSALGGLQDLINSRVSRENDYQRFFELNPEIIYLLGSYDDFKSHLKLQLTHVVSVDAGSKERIPDFFLHNSVTGLWDVLEIKPPFVNGEMFIKEGSGTHDLGPGVALRHGLKQLRNYGKVLEQGEVLKLMRTKYNMRVLRPRLMLLVGLSENIPMVPGFSRAELLRSASDSIDIFTYDQLTAMAQDKFR